MVFSSTIFLFLFLPCTLLLYYFSTCFHRTQILNAILIFASIVFYAWGGVDYLIILMLVVVINYVLALLIKKYPSQKLLILIVAMVLDIGNLLYFKYFNFFVDNFLSISRILGNNVNENIKKIALPIGISYYTFQIISYVIDVYKGRIEPQRNILKLTLYLIMFPQLIAGPIVRYTDINKEIDERTISFEDTANGIKRFIIGLAKKVFVANAMGGMADVVFSGDAGGNSVFAWVGAICYSLQIFYDFSAYSDMAIGIGLMLGFHFNENFDLPYTSLSIQEFWRRWHISLSSWFRDYVYIPLGGNRKGRNRTYLNLFIVFLLTGFWHGAAWQFIIWGLYHCFFIFIEKMGFGKVLEKMPRFVRRVYVLIIVTIGWVLFRADTFGLAISYLKNMFSFDFSGIKQYSVVSKVDSVFIICSLVAVIFSFINLASIKRFIKDKHIKTIIFGD